jgi:hypothetical protein
MPGLVAQFLPSALSGDRGARKAQPATLDDALIVCSRGRVRAIGVFSVFDRIGARATGLRTL